MAQFSSGSHLEQRRTGLSSLLRGEGSVVYVDSTNGNNGNSGKDIEHAVLTLTRGLAIAQAGDTIICAPGGSETVTTSLAMNKARVKIVCPAESMSTGFSVTGAGTLDLMTVSAADCMVEGLKFVRSAGAGSTTAGLLTTAAADRLHVKGCFFDSRLTTTPWQNYGVEITDDCQDVLIDGCKFVDLHRGVLFSTGTGKNQIGSIIRDCEFWVGQATAFGVYSEPAGTGTVSAVQVIDCFFLEQDGDGSAATDAWDGSDGTDAASGTIWFDADVDRYLIAGCTAYTALAQTFDTLSMIDSGAAGDYVNNKSATAADIDTAVGSVGTLVGSVGTQLGTAATADSSAVASVGTQLGTAATADSSAVASTGVQLATAASWDVRTVKATGVVLTGGSIVDQFTIANGPVEIYSLIVHVTSAVSADACALSWELDPTTGASNTALCTGVDIVSAASGDAFYIDGTSANAAVKAAVGTAIPLTADKHPVLLPGGLDMILANSNPSTGAADIYLTYRAMGATAVVTSA